MLLKWPWPRQSSPWPWLSLGSQVLCLGLDSRVLNDNTAHEEWRRDAHLPSLGHGAWPLLARPMVAFPAVGHHFTAPSPVPSYTAWWQRHVWTTCPRSQWLPESGMAGCCTHNLLSRESNVLMITPLSSPYVIRLITSLCVVVIQWEWLHEPVNVNGTFLTLGGPLSQQWPWHVPAVPVRYSIHRSAESLRVCAAVWYIKPA